MGSRLDSGDGCEWMIGVDSRCGCLPVDGEAVVAKIERTGGGWSELV